MQLAHPLPVASAPERDAVGRGRQQAAIGNISDIPVADGTDGVTFGVRLYETAPNAWSAVAVELAPTNQLILQSAASPVPISIANIHTIGMISGALLPPYIDNFALDVTPVPEPNSLALLGFGALGMLCHRLFRSRRKRD
ncbi:MAG: PEP-CTERM sorting domain-containing protein [Pirellulales bacterium]